MIVSNLERDGFCLLPKAVSPTQVKQLQSICSKVFEEDTEGILARSSRGHVYAARNLIDSVPEIQTAWQSKSLLQFLRSKLGTEFGLVRVLYFDKPPERSWALAWHKDQSIAVQDNSLKSPFYSRPTTKAGVPHVIADDDILRRMLTLRIHLDAVTAHNGPLCILPGSHLSSQSEGAGVEQAVPILADASDVLAMRPLVTHGSGSSDPGTRLHRRILHLEFAADRSLPDGYEWHRFVTS